jgi:hypothetical protein
MGTAVHGKWCGARAWPANCPTCGAHVFFFMCDCGSRVFFDELGAPWPIHDCDTSWARGLRRTSDESGRLTVELRPGITVTRLPDSFEVDDPVILRANPTGPRREPIVAIRPHAGFVQVTGVLRELDRAGNPLRSYRLDDASVGRALLGPLGKGRYGRVTIHSPGIDDQLESFTTWVPHDWLADSRIRRGLTVAVVLEGIEIPAREGAWICADFDVLG